VWLTERVQANSRARARKATTDTATTLLDIYKVNRRKNDPKKSKVREDPEEEASSMDLKMSSSAEAHCPPY
jgi:hypothetical protein